MPSATGRLALARDCHVDDILDCPAKHAVETALRSKLQYHALAFRASEQGEDKRLLFLQKLVEGSLEPNISRF